MEYYNGAHTAEAIYSFVQASKNSKVVQLTPELMRSSVQRSDSVWLVDFSAGQWCGPCTFLKSSLRQTAHELDGVAKVGIFDCDKHRQWCQENGVQYYPFLKVFPSGAGLDAGIPLEYNQQMTPASNMLNLFGVFAKIFTRGKSSKGGNATMHGVHGSDDDDDGPPVNTPEREQELDALADHDEL